MSETSLFKNVGELVDYLLTKNREIPVFGADNGEGVQVFHLDLDDSRRDYVEFS